MLVASDEATAGLGHQIGRAGAPFEKIGQPARLLFLGAESLDHLHVARVRSGAVENLGSERRPAHFLGEVGVFDRRQAVALVGAGQPEVPQALGARLGLERFADLDHARCLFESVALASDLRLVLLFQRHNLVAHHRPNGGDERTDFVSDAEIHMSLPCSCRSDLTLKIEARQAEKSAVDLARRFRRPNPRLLRVARLCGLAESGWRAEPLEPVVLRLASPGFDLRPARSGNNIAVSASPMIMSGRPSHSRIASAHASHRAPSNCETAVVDRDSNRNLEPRRARSRPSPVTFQSRP